MYQLTCVVALSILPPVALLVAAQAPSDHGVSSAATQQAPQRDKPVARTGTAAIEGRVLTADTGTPVRLARISLDTGNPLESHGTMTDLDGWFAFTDLAAGSYRVSASKGNYVTLEYGQRRAFQRGTPIELTDGQVAAVDALEPGDEHDPALLEQLRASATRVVLGWGDSRDVPLQLKRIDLR